MQKWEYLVGDIPAFGLESELRKLGADGWELFYVRFVSAADNLTRLSRYEVIFKRPKGGD